MKNKNIGAWLFIIGLAGSIGIGILQGLGIEMFVNATWVPWFLVVVGLGIGIYNISASETQGILLSALVLGAASGIMLLLPASPRILDEIFSKIAFLALAIAVPPALKEVWKKANK